MNARPKSIVVESIENKIYLIRGQRVMLTHDLAEIYQVPAKRLIEAVKRNIGRFPGDFMFPLSYQEVANLKSQFATSSLQLLDINEYSDDKPKIGRRELIHGGRRKLPYAFTEQGVSMLSAVLKSPRAVAASIEIIRTFVRLRQLLASNVELSRRLDELEKKYDHKFSIVFDAIRQLMTPPATSTKRRLGF